jgi:Spy/CpxP family protein refolding chaperone
MMNRTIPISRTVAMLGTALLVTVAAAQDVKRHAQHDPAARSKARTEQMTRSLELTPDQAAKIQSIQDHYHPRFEKARQIEDQELRKQTVRELRSTRENEIRSVLTPEQEARWKEMQAERKAHMEKRKALHKEQHLGKDKAPRMDRPVRPKHPTTAPKKQ